MKIKIMSIVLILLLIAAPASAKGRYGANWETTITIIYGLDNVRLTIGGDKTATEEFENRWETRAILAGSLNGYFYHPEWGLETAYFWSDIKDLTFPKEWTFYLASGYVNQQISMNWGLADVPDTIELYLTDTTAGVAIDMRAQTSYTYLNTSSAVRTFMVTADGNIEGEDIEQPPVDPADTTAPAISLNQPDPSSLWPPNSRMVDVTITGNASDAGAGLDTVSYIMMDEYGEFAYSGDIEISANGDFSFIMSLKAERTGSDKDGRTYSVTVTAADKAGNTSVQSTAISVPHDQKK